MAVTLSLNPARLKRKVTEYKTKARGDKLDAKLKAEAERARVKAKKPIERVEKKAQKETKFKKTKFGAIKRHKLPKKVVKIKRK
jgi:hypothetical protein